LIKQSSTISPQSSAGDLLSPASQLAATPNRLAVMTNDLASPATELAATPNRLPSPPSMKANIVEMKDKAGTLKSGQLVSLQLTAYRLPFTAFPVVTFSFAFVSYHNRRTRAGFNSILRLSFSDACEYHSSRYNSGKFYRR
jgi:hypothetical protein